MDIAYYHMETLRKETMYKKTGETKEKWTKWLLEGCQAFPQPRDITAAQW